MSIRKNTGLQAGNRFVRAAVAAAAVVALGASASVASAQVGETYAPGRILVMPRAGLPDAALDKMLKDNGALRGRRVGKSELRIVDVSPGTERQAVQRFAQSPHLKFAELDRIVRFDATSNDPYAGSQWHLSKIRTPMAWDRSQGSGITIAILDTGIDASHVDLAAQIVPGWNFWDGNSNTADVYGHGTKVAGAASAATNNSLGVAGVAGMAKIMPIRIGDASGGLSYSAAAQGLTYAADRGVRVANISAAVVASSSSVLSAAQYMKGKGGLVFVSSGNTGAATSVSPTSNMVIVGATDANDALAGFSTYGSAIALSAPGAGIYTTTNGGGYGAVSGTSFSAPIAAGVAALVMAANPSLSSSQVESILYKSALDLGAIGRDAYYGYGRVDAAAAVQLALDSVGTAGGDTLAPTAGIISPAGGTSVSGVVAIDVSVSDNIGVSSVSLLLNGRVIATDATAPFAFSWDSATVPNGSASLALTAYDAAGNSGASAAVAVNVANAVVVDILPPTVTITNPTNGGRVSGSVKVTSVASDDSGSTALRQSLFINNRLVASGTGPTLSYTWNTRKVALGSHSVRADARDAAGNLKSTTVSAVVFR